MQEIELKKQEERKKKLEQQKEEEMLKTMTPEEGWRYKKRKEFEKDLFTQKFCFEDEVVMNKDKLIKIKREQMANY